MNIKGRGWIEVSKLRKILTEIPGNYYITTVGDNKPLHVGKDVTGPGGGAAMGSIDLASETPAVQTEEIS